MLWTFVTLCNYLLGFHLEVACFVLFSLLTLTYKRDYSGSIKNSIELVDGLFPWLGVCSLTLLLFLMGEGQ